jgi:RIO-like serine/threonine protein kinase
MTKLSKRSLALLTALEDGPKAVSYWGFDVTTKFKGYHQGCADLLWRRGLIHCTRVGGVEVFRLTFEGRDALEKAREASK